MTTTFRPFLVSLLLSLMAWSALGAHGEALAEVAGVSRGQLFQLMLVPVFCFFCHLIGQEPALASSRRHRRGHGR